MSPALSDIPVVTSQQGLNSTTWTRPPLFSSLTIPELYAFHAEKSPNHPVIVFDDEHGNVQTLYHRDVFRGIRKAAKIVSERLPQTILDDDGHTTIGILAVTDSPTYLTIQVGIMYLGHTPFPISARNSSVAVAHLIRKTSLRQLFVSRDAAMQRIAHEAKEQLANDGYEVELLPLPEFTDLYNDGPEPDIPMSRIVPDKPALILHSSGSTSFPKPITILHRTFSQWGYTPYFSNTDMCGLRVSFHGLPLFHVMGTFSIAWIVGTGVTAAFFRPSSPPIASTPETLLNAAVASKVDGLVCVPTFLETWGRDPANVPVLQQLRFILFAGAPLSKEIGGLLHNSGVRLATGFGATEVGALTRDISPSDLALRGEWEYFALTPVVEQARIYQEGQPGVFELVILESETMCPNVLNTEVDGRRGYATNDLMMEHPEHKEYMKVVGRKDDQIILSTGEKTNPVPMEAILLQDSNIAAAIIFGRARTQNGVIIQPKEPFDPSDEVKLEAFRNQIWPTVERVNEFAPSHSRLFKELITVTKPNKPFQYTAKGTPRRHVSLDEYAEEIEELYKKLEESSQVDIPVPPSWSAETVRTYVRGVVKKVMKVPNIEDDDDLFQQGGDSLQATWIRNTVLHAIRTTTKLSVHDIPLNFVYNNPSITQLAFFLLRILSGTAVGKEEERASRLTQMESMLSKYSSTFPKPSWRGSSSNRTGHGPSQETILITGTTGRLGSQLLTRILAEPEVVHVYALNRGVPGDSATLEKRHREVFRAWNLDEHVLDGGRVTFLSGDLSKPGFNLDQRTFEQLRASVTAIIQNGWRVDFNVSLPSFEPLLAGARNVVDFALSSAVAGGPRLLFVSSISALFGYSSTTPAPESLEYGPEYALGTGYGESKWITEQMLWRATRETGLRTTSVRVGQLSGDSQVGGWNTKEWIPSIVRASKRLGLAPERDDTVSWVPIDIASAALLEMLYSDEPILHLTSPKPASWNDVFQPIAKKIAVPLVSTAEWLEKLKESARAANEVQLQTDTHESAHTLIIFFEASLSNKEVLFATHKASAASHTLARLGPLGEPDALRWVAYWESVGFLNV
ncbi:acetyl-CoA synthetase-like protein [Dichomitus squalens]|uniref:Acetyl-CoA synthetase-like protein n=1 Tax=Dichomitus squalens TaxID=114155 RepID=A0A4Q9PHS5_9APHY|nr:acetyl-CoA synthetase-like protein [Dichomitus squalens]